MTLFGIVSLINGILLSFIAFLLIRMKTQTRLGRDIGYVAISIALWCFGYSIWQSVSDEASAEMWVTIMMIPVMFIPLFFSRMMVHFLEKKVSNSWGIYFSYAFAVFFSIGTALGFLSDGVETRMPFLNYSPNAGILFVPFIIFFFLTFFYYIIVMLQQYPKASPIMRLRMKYLTIGSIAAYLGTITNYFLWFDIPILPIGNFFLTLCLAVVFYSIVVHHTMDARLLFRKWVVQVLTIVFLIVNILLLKYVFSYFFPKYSFWFDIFILIHGVFVYEKIKKKFFAISNKYFFTSLYDPSDVMEQLSDKLNSTLDINLIYKHIYDTFANTFHMDSFAILLYEKQQQRYVVAHKAGFKRIRKKYISNINVLHDRYIRKNLPIIVEEARSYSEFENNEELDQMHKYSIEVMMPLNVGQKTFGLLLLGEKITKDVYNDDDLRILKTMGEQIALAIGNALQYQQVKNFNATLSEEVQRQTKELREANEELKKLDYAKSEFITLASHQLRTPLTAIRGYLDLLMSGMYGKYSGKIGGVMKTVSAASNRLSNLIEDLLMLSKIEAGNLQFTKTNVDLHELMSEMGRRFLPIAKSKKIEYVMNIPMSLPMLMLDKDKVRMVIINIIDNALRYSEKGSVVVNV
ncbi:MAG: hypothetical protein ACD_9C00118G0004, partial [uncultured bacterium]